jgi:hypothetical protein
MNKKDTASTTEWVATVIIAVLFTILVFSIHGCNDWKTKYINYASKDDSNYDLAWKYKEELNQSLIDQAILKGNIRVLEVQLESEIDKSVLVKSNITEGVEKVLETNNEFLNKLKGE